MDTAHGPTRVRPFPSYNLNPNFETGSVPYPLRIDSKSILSCSGMAWGRRSTALKFESTGLKFWFKIDGLTAMFCLEWNAIF